MKQRLKQEEEPSALWVLGRSLLCIHGNSILQHMCQKTQVQSTIQTKVSLVDSHWNEAKRK